MASLGLAQNLCLLEPDEHLCLDVAQTSPVDMGTLLDLAIMNGCRERLKHQYSHSEIRTFTAVWVD